MRVRSRCMDQSNQHTHSRLTISHHVFRCHPARVLFARRQGWHCGRSVGGMGVLSGLGYCCWLLAGYQAVADDGRREGSPKPKACRLGCACVERLQRHLESQKCMRRVGFKDVMASFVSFGLLRAGWFRWHCPSACLPSLFWGERSLQSGAPKLDRRPQLNFPDHTQAVSEQLYGFVTASWLLAGGAPGGAGQSWA